jgi:hypothetical protein
VLLYAERLLSQLSNVLSSLLSVSTCVATVRCNQMDDFQREQMANSKVGWCMFKLKVVGA